MTNLSRLRKAAHLTQEQLSEALAVNRSTLAMWETGANTPPTKYLLPWRMHSTVPSTSC